MSSIYKCILHAYGWTETFDELTLRFYERILVIIVVAGLILAELLDNCYII